MTPSGRAKFWGYVSLALTVLMVLMVIALSYMAFVNRQALCQFTNDLQRRYETNVNLLAEQSGPTIRAYGLTIPREQFELTVAGQQRTLESLGGLRCSWHEP